MSVLNVPRVHFAGVAVTRLPTGPRSGLLDMAENRPLIGTGHFPLDRPAADYAEFLEAAGGRFDASGAATPDGPFHTVKGWNFGGNGHFWIDAKVVSCERISGIVDTADPLVGRQVDFWGHYCEYTAGSANRARIYDVDPASNWTTTVMVGQLALGRLGRSHEVGYLVTGEVNGCCPPRWQNRAHLRDVGDHPLASWLSRSVVYQFAIGATEGLRWLDRADVSPALNALRTLIDSGGADGITVQFALTDMAMPAAADQPDRWALRGTIGPWRATELRTYPAGRLLTAQSIRAAGADARPHVASVRVAENTVVANLITAIPARHRAESSGAGAAPRPGPFVDLGDLELRTESGDLVAVFPRDSYLGERYHLTSGVLTVPRLDGGHGNPDSPLCLTASGRVLLEETETVVQSDDACLFLEHPNHRTGEDFAVGISLRSYVRGEPVAVESIRLLQYFNPRALPLDATAQAPAARPGDIAIAGLRGPGSAEYTSELTIGTGRDGRARVTVRGLRAGTTRILLLPAGAASPAPENATAAYDNDDELGYWPAAGSISVRVLPDYWYLDELADDEVDFKVLYRDVLAYYALLYSFMHSEVFSLADEFKVEPYARLIWHVCDPAHRDRTYFMPSTRDIGAPQLRLLLRYFLSKEARRQTPPGQVPGRCTTGTITTREQLCTALDQALSVELAVMIQYLYAAYSIPTHDAAERYVAEGVWIAEQLRLACGAGPRTLDNGFRGALMTVAREEMMHFLAINNIRMAIGLPFRVPAIDFGRPGPQLCLPLEFSLAPFGLDAAQRFAELERPHDLVPGIAGDTSTPPDPYRYGSLSELYAAIRDGIQRVPGVVIAERGQGGGGHHLFVRESINAVHPDYQLEVDDVASAVFAIDFVTEHGEGGKIASTMPAEESHFDTFVRVADLLAGERTNNRRPDRVPWNPAYPVLRNPTLDAAHPARDLVSHLPARQAMRVFNRSYQLMAQLMVQHFGSSPTGNLRRSRLMNWALDIMVAVLRPVGELIVGLPSGRPGRTAGPSFELDHEPLYIARTGIAMERLAREACETAELARRCDGLTAAVPDLLEFLATQFRAYGAGEL